LLAERWLIAFVSYLLADVGDLGAHLVHDLLDAAPDCKITPRGAARGQTRQMGQHHAADALDQRIDIRPPYQLALLPLDPDAQKLGLGFGMFAAARADRRSGERRWARYFSRD
jgi:hypothetical protein